MIDKNLFIQDLKQVYTVLQELKVNEKMIKQLIDKYNLTEEDLNLTKEELQEIKPYVDSIKDFIVQNDNTTEIGGNLEIDGNVELNSSLTVHDTLNVDGIVDFNTSVNFNGTLNVNEDVSISGELSLESVDKLVFNDGSSLGGKEYLHRITLLVNEDGDSVEFNIKNDNINEFTVSSFIEYLQNYRFIIGVHDFYKGYASAYYVEDEDTYITFYMIEYDEDYLPINIISKTISIDDIIEFYDDVILL